MAMIQCDECGDGVSNKAASCPNCGAPIQGTSTQTTEDTSKKWKAHEAFAGILMGLGFLGCCAGGGSEQPALGAAAWGLAILGAAWGIIAKAGEWWDNG